jgi:hypothetical protein
MLTAPSVVLTDFVFNEEGKPQRHKEHKEFYLFFVLFVSLWFSFFLHTKYCGFHGRYQRAAFLPL